MPHVVKGERLTGTDCEYGREGARFATPALDLNSLVWPRNVARAGVRRARRRDHRPAGAGGRLAGHRTRRASLEEALVSARRTSPLPAEVVDRSYEHLPKVFDRESMEFQIRAELGGPDVLDGWREIVDAPTGRVHRIRAFPPRLVHVIAGNSPGVAAVSIVRGALIKGLNLIKLPSNDLFTAPAILQAMADVAPGHPVTRSFSAAYWRGGDERVEGTLFRPQFFDKLVAWGGGDTIVNAKKYVGPGFELVAFDPKTSISLVGREAFESDATLAAVADLAAADATLVEQQACASSRFQFVEGIAGGGRPLLRTPAAAHGHRTADDERRGSTAPHRAP